MPTTQARMFQRRRTAAQWTSENPTLADGEIGFERDTGIVKIGNGTTAWNSLAAMNQVAELVADDPTEIDLDTAGSLTTITLLDEIARRAHVYGIGQYYWSIQGASAANAMTQDQAVFHPLWLQMGTLDRIGCEITTAVAATTVRVAIYTDSGGLPNNLVVQGSDSAATTGLKDITVSGSVPINGRYWSAVVIQGAAGVSVAGGPNSGPGFGLPMPLGTNSANVAGAAANYARIQNTVTGAFASPAAVTNSPSGLRARIHFRYSA